MIDNYTSKDTTQSEEVEYSPRIEKPPNFLPQHLYASSITAKITSKDVWMHLRRSWQFLVIRLCIGATLVQFTGHI